MPSIRKRSNTGSFHLSGKIRACIGPKRGPVRAKTAENACMGPENGPVRAVRKHDLSDVNRFAQEMGLLSRQQVDEYLASGTPFSDVCDEAVGSADIGSIETGRLDTFLFGDKNGPFVMKFLTDDDEYRLTENLPGSDHGIQSPESGIIQENDLFGYSLVDQCLFHLLRLVVLFLPVIAADEDPVDLTGLIKLGRRIDPGKEKQVGAAKPSNRRRSKHQGRMVVGDIGHRIVKFAFGIPVDSDIAIQNESQQDQAQP